MTGPHKQKMEAGRAAVLAAISGDQRKVAGDDQRKVAGDDAGQGPIARPCWRVFDDWTEIDGKRRAPGVWRFDVKTGADGVPTDADLWVCSPLHVTAVTHAGGDDFGRLLRFKPTRGPWREWPMPMELLKGAGEELRGHLLRCGVEIDPKNRTLLATYLQGQHPARDVMAIGHTGWHCGERGRLFVLPREVIGQGDTSGVIFQSAHIERSGGEYGIAGTMDGWRADIGARLAGNAVLIFAVSAALAGTLQGPLARTTGGGVHLYGESSKGKTATLLAAASVWGGRDFCGTWRATANGLEGTAERRNDTVLLLDEMKQADPREIDQIVYMLGNGTGKARAGRDGSPRAARRWLLFALSNGEQPLHVFMAADGRRVHAGQDVRLPSVLVTDRAHGAFDCIHGEATPKRFADTLMAATQRHYGHVGPAFIRALLESGDIDRLSELEEIALGAFAHDGEQEGRVAASFALAALAGTLAVKYGLLPIGAGEAQAAAVDLYDRWRASRPGGNHESARVLEAVADFIARHGDSRFSDLAPGGFNDLPVRVVNRAGFFKTGADGDRVYLFTSAGLREAVAGFDLSYALTVLDAAGWIVERGQTRLSKATRAGGTAQRLYYLAPKQDGGA